MLLRTPLIITMVISFIIMFFILFRYIYSLIKKNKKVEGSNNKIFLKNDWNNYQYFQFNMSTKKIKFQTIKKKIISKIKKWEKKQYWFSSCNSLKTELIITVSRQLSDYLVELVSKKVPLYNEKPIPFYIIFFKNETRRVGCFLSHYYCDGQVFLEFLNYMTGSCQKINFLKYRYIPLISDIKIIRYLINLINSGKRCRRKLLLSEKSYICVMKKKIDSQFMRYDSYSHIFNMIFRFIPNDRIKVAFTVGIDDPHSMFNRIGVITRIIRRQASLIDYKIILKKKLQNSLGEALVCYDLLKSYPIHLLRQNFNNNIDVILTSFKFNSYSKNKSLCNFEFSSFLGSGKVPIYINSFSSRDQLITSFKISTDDFNTKKFIKNKQCQLVYTFKSIDTQNIYFRRYINYKNKYLVIKRKNNLDRKKQKKLERIKKIQQKERNKLDRLKKKNFTKTKIEKKD